MKSKGRFSSFPLFLPAFVLSSLRKRTRKLSLLQAPEKKIMGWTYGSPETPFRIILKRISFPFLS